MKKIVDIIIKDVLKRVDEIEPLDEKDRIFYVRNLVQEISGISMDYLSLGEAKKIIREVEKGIKKRDWFYLYEN